MLFYFYCDDVRFCAELRIFQCCGRLQNDNVIVKESTAYLPPYAIDKTKHCNHRRCMNVKMHHFPAELLYTARYTLAPDVSEFTNLLRL